MASWCVSSIAHLSRARSRRRCGRFVSKRWPIDTRASFRAASNSGVPWPAPRGVDPEPLLLEEPLSNLDAHLREEMRFEVRRLHDEFRYTTVYVTHDQAEAMTTADRIVVMNAGRVEQVGTP